MKVRFNLDLIPVAIVTVCFLGAIAALVALLKQFVAAMAGGK